MKFVPVIVALLSFSATAYTAEITIYRWVDSNNVVHFSQNQPDHSNFTEISMQEFQKNITKRNQSSLTAANNIEEKKAAQPAIKQEERCLTARKNLATLEKFELIQYKTDAGEMKILTAKEKKDQLALNKQQVDLFCNN